MRSSRLDIVPLLDIVLLMFFALALSMQQKHKKEKRVLIQKIKQNDKKLRATHRRFQKETSHHKKLKKRYQTLHSHHTELQKVMVQIRRLMASLHLSKKSSKQQTTQRRAVVLRRQLKTLRASILRLRSEHLRLHRAQEEAKQLAKQLTSQLERVTQKLKQARLEWKLLRQKNITLLASRHVLNQVQKKLHQERNALFSRVTQLRMRLALMRSENQRLKKNSKRLKEQRQKQELLAQQLKIALHKQCSQRTNRLGQKIQKQEARWKALQWRSIRLQAELTLFKRKAKRLSKEAQKWRRKYAQAHILKLRNEATARLVKQSNARLEKALRAAQLELHKHSFFRTSERSTFRQKMKQAELRERALNAQNERLKSSHRQISNAMKRLRMLGRLSGREKSSLTKSMTRYLQAVFIYVKSDRITGFRRFKDPSIIRLDRPIGLTRRSIRNQRLRYRSVIEPGFSAFARLDARLPADVVTSTEAIYIFVLDENCTKAATSGLEHEHQTKYKQRRVIWQL